NRERPAVVGTSVTSLDGPMSTWPMSPSSSATRPRAPVRSDCPAASVLWSVTDFDAIDAGPATSTTVHDGVAGEDGRSHSGVTASATVAGAASGKRTYDAGPRRLGAAVVCRSGGGGCR